MSKTKASEENNEYNLPDLERLQACIEKIISLDDRVIAEKVIKGVFNKIPYGDDTRLKCLALHFAANSRGLTAPAYRAVLSSHKKNGHTVEEEIIDRDRQLIDIHYLFCQHRSSLTLINGEYESLLGTDLEKFNYGEASRFVGTKGFATNKANKILGIPDAIQLELCILRSKKIRVLQKAQIESKQCASRKVFDRQRHPSSRLSKDKAKRIVSDLWPLIIADGSPIKATYYKQLITGIKMNDKEQKIETRKVSESKRWLIVGYVSGFSKWDYRCLRAKAKDH